MSPAESEVITQERVASLQASTDHPGGGRRIAGTYHEDWPDASEVEP